jgi:hypothetical protein
MYYATHLHLRLLSITTSFQYRLQPVLSHGRRYNALRTVKSLHIPLQQSTTNSPVNRKDESRHKSSEVNMLLHKRLSIAGQKCGVLVEVTSIASTILFQITNLLDV